jgi:hypothetical protein
MNHRLFGPMMRVLQYPDLHCARSPLTRRTRLKLLVVNNPNPKPGWRALLSTHPSLKEMLFDWLQNLVRYPDTRYSQLDPLLNRLPVSGNRY